MHTDINFIDWVSKHVPQWARPYARLMRLDRPIGTWLLLLPCWWGVALAGGEGVVPDLWLMVLFAFGAIVMRGAGCVINDIYDRDIDRKVERTRERPLASGVLGLIEAGALAIILMLIGLIVLVMFNVLTIRLGVASLALVALYPLAKRVTWWPQLILGLAFNWGALMGWASVRGELNAPAYVLYLAGIFWTLAYDTIYAHQDKRDDAMIGIKSLALRLGESSLPWVAGFMTASLVLLAVAGAMAELNLAYYFALIPAALHAWWQIKTWSMDNPGNCLRRFRSNRDFGLLVFLAIAIGRIF